MPYEPPAREIESLLELCRISLDAETDNFKMRRFFQVTLWVDTGNSARTRQVFDRVLSLVLAELKLNDFSQIDGVAWGPFEGSRYISIFGESNDEPDGPSFRDRLKRVGDRLKRKLPAATKGAKVILIVAGTAITVAGGAAPAAIVFGVPLAVTKGIVIAGSLVSGSEALRKVFQQQHDEAVDGTGSKEPKKSGNSPVAPKQLDIAPQSKNVTAAKDDSQEALSERRRKDLRRQKTEAEARGLNLKLGKRGKHEK